MYINGTPGALAFDKCGHQFQLLLSGRSEIEDRHIEIVKLKEGLCFIELSREIKDRSDTLPRRRLRFGIVQLPANPNPRSNFVPGTALPFIVKQRDVLTGERGSKHTARAQRQAAINLSVNLRAETEVARRHNRQR